MGIAIGIGSMCGVGVGGDRDGDKDGDVNICSPTTTQPSHISAREWQPSPIRL